MPQGDTTGYNQHVIFGCGLILAFYRRETYTDDVDGKDKVKYILFVNKPEIELRYRGVLTPPEVQQGWMERSYDLSHETILRMSGDSTRIFIEVGFDGRETDASRKEGALKKQVQILMTENKTLEGQITRLQDALRRKTQEVYMEVEQAAELFGKMFEVKRRGPYKDDEDEEPLGG